MPYLACSHKNKFFPSLCETLASFFIWFFAISKFKKSNRLLVFFFCRYLNPLKNIQSSIQQNISYQLWILMAWINMKSLLNNHVLFLSLIFIYSTLSFNISVSTILLKYQFINYHDEMLSFCLHETPLSFVFRWPFFWTHKYHIYLFWIQIPMNIWSIFNKTKMLLSMFHQSHFFLDNIKPSFLF